MLRIGFALCGSYCTFQKALELMQLIIEKGHTVIPIMSTNAYTTDTRFGKAEEHIKKIEDLCKMKPLCSAVDVEPIGPKDMIDLLLIAPCTGNTLAKLALGISDTPVTGAAKSQLRGGKPVVIAASTNDALGASCKNIGMLMNTRNIYFVPMRQDAPDNKPFSMVADLSLALETIEKAMEGRQIQPVYIS